MNTEIKPITAEELAKIATLATPELPYYLSGGDEPLHDLLTGYGLRVALTRDTLANLVAAINAVPGLLATIAVRDVEIDALRAERDGLRMALDEKNEIAGAELAAAQAEVRRLLDLTAAYERYNRASKSLVETSGVGDLRAAVAEFQAADAALVAKGGVS